MEIMSQPIILRTHIFKYENKILGKIRSRSFIKKYPLFANMFNSHQCKFGFQHQIRMKINRLINKKFPKEKTIVPPRFSYFDGYSFHHIRNAYDIYTYETPVRRTQSVTKKINGLYMMSNFYSSGVKMVQEWIKEDGSHHREDGPAYTNFYPNGVLAIEKWYVNGGLHKNTSPAIIKYNDSGCIIETEWHIDEVDLTKEIESWIKENNMPENHTEWNKDQQLLFKLTWG